MEPDLPFEFLVPGIAPSFQGASSGPWQEIVRSAASDRLPEGAWLLDCALSVTIFLFVTERFPGDIDNRIKPILDAMKLCVYMDDEYVERVTIRKIEPGRKIEFRGPSDMLLDALDEWERGNPVIYIRVGDELDEESF